MNDNDTLADDLRKDSLALMKLLADERHKSEALAAELNEQARVNGMGGSREAALLAKVARLEKALREIAVGLTAEDAVAGFSQRYQLCAGRLCKIARDALTAPETAGEPK